MASIDWSNPEAAMQAMQAMGIGAGLPGGLPMPKTVTASEVREERSRRAASIFKSYNLLHDVLERHEATIQKRWSKKTKEQRRKILVGAWPSMAKAHRSDFQQLRKDAASRVQNAAQHREACMWPFINEEDLTKTRTLPLLLNARGRNEPSAFAAGDLEAMHIGIVTTAVMPAFLNEHIMVFTPRRDVESYGELLHWDDHPEAFNWMMSKRCPHPGEGLLILESQERTMSFLVACMKAILHDISESSLLDSPLQDAPAATLNDTGCDSLATMAAEAPYRPPAELSFSRIESLLAARRNAAADHLWALREDPAYYSEVMLASRDHRQETLKDMNGNVHPLFRFGREDILWSRVVGNEITNGFLQLEVFANLQTQAANLKVMQERYRGDIHPEKNLPQPYLDAILRLRHYLDQAAKGPVGVLKMHLVSSPPFRSMFVRRPEENPEETRIGVLQKPGLKLEHDEQELLWLARTLWEDGQDLFLARLTNVVDELQRLIDSSAKARSLISPYIANVISDLSIISECMRQIDIYQPWSSEFEEHMVDKRAGIQEEFASTSAPWSRLLKALTGSQTALARYGAPSEGRFHYPIDKKRTRQTTEAMQQAEANLDIFWRKVDEILHLNAGDLNGFIVKSLLHERILQRTQGWVEPAKHKPVAIVEALTKPLSEVYFDLEQRTEQTLKAPTSRPQKTKRKTRTEATDQQQAVPEADHAVDNTDSHTHFEVDQRALKVFRTLFYTPSLSSSPGEISWTDFLHALRSIGFVGEKLYGSAWQFRPYNLDVEKSIQFHEPHPSGKIPFRTARRHGRRLTRSYGWSGTTFSLIEKTNG